MSGQPDRPPTPWPRAEQWTLAGRREAVTEARDHVRDFLTADSPPVAPATLRDGLLVVSELVTNAVLHAPGPCTLCLAYVDGALAIAVHDTSPALPVPRAPDLTTATGGFGWHLLTRLTSRIEVHPEVSGGKTVTAVLPVSLP